MSHTNSLPRGDRCQL